MPKYKLQLVKYTLPDAIKKYNDKLKLKETKNQRDEVQKQLKELEDKHKNKTDNLSEDEYKNQRDKLLSKITKFNNAIYEIKAELNNSTVNFNNANIKELNTNISDISSLINNNQFNSKIGAQISNLLTSQVKLNDIFESENFKEMLKDIVEKVSKTQNEEVKKRIQDVIQEVNKNNNTANENYQAWVAIRDEIKKAIPDNLQDIIKKYGDDIKKINELKTELYNIIFKKDVDKVSEEELEEYNYKFLLLSNLYDLVEKNLKDKYIRAIDSGDFSNLNTGFSTKDIQNIINNLRKWFSADDFKSYSKTNEILVPNISNNKLFNAAFVKAIEPIDIRKAVDFIKSNDSEGRKFDIFINKDDYIDLENKKKEKKNKRKREIEVDNRMNEMNNKNELNEMNDKVSEGLDLDEIQFWRSLSSTNMNIMNGIIKSLDNIIYNQNRIIELLTKQSFSEGSKQNYSQNPPQKLGRFKVEKYKPNMSITEFKKLFSKLE